MYIHNIINRIKRFSLKLERIELFVDKPWVIIDDDKCYQKYVFKRDKTLILSVNGKVQIGSWDYIPSANSILIDRVTDKILLNQLYFDEASMALKMDGFTDEYFFLVNENLVPDLNIEKYLKKIFYRKFNIVTGILDTGKTLEIFLEKKDFPMIGMKATIEGDVVKYAKLKPKNSDAYYEIENSQIIRIFYPHTYKIESDRLITIEHKTQGIVEKGDLVHYKNQLIDDGKYKIGFMKKIIIRNGVIKKVSII
jgi:hypothetical protein